MCAPAFYRQIRRQKYPFRKGLKALEPFVIRLADLSRTQQADVRKSAEEPSDGLKMEGALDHPWTLEDELPISHVNPAIELESDFLEMRDLFEPEFLV